MSLVERGGDLVHTPKRRDVFEFDAEVASIFDSMAVRSIPMYEEVHKLHASLLRHKFLPGAHVLDVGSSTGRLFRAIENQLGMPLCSTGLVCTAIDSSVSMMERLRKEFPYVRTLVSNIHRTAPLYLKADVTYALYVLQFVPKEGKSRAYDWIVDSLKPGGVLVLGQKEEYPDVVYSGDAQEEYYRFRRDNGYSQEEIDAKTVALAGSMWPVPAEELVEEFSSRGVFLVETTRWLQFSTLVGVKR